MIRTHYFIVAVNRQAQIVGFSSITKQGYLHSMFVHKDFQGRGIASMLLDEIEQYANITGIMRIMSEASLTARSVLRKKRLYCRERAEAQGKFTFSYKFLDGQGGERNEIFYKGRIPACGVFCGGCPMYMREERPCQGADLNRSRCEKCKTFHLCCLEKGITHCFQCTDFPCAKFKGFAKRWLKYGQNFVENQETLKRHGAKLAF